jgi:uncharacterized protein YqjF (DUF2071 family)
MLNYEIDPDIIRPLVPAGTELDFFAGRTYVSLVGFMFLDTKVKGLGIPFHRDFEEVNLRFYVRRQVDGETRRGVVFVKELVPRAAIAWVARTVYGERYLALPMRHQISKQSVEYSWRFENKWNSFRLNFGGPASLPEPGSEEQFITEHYWGYATQRDGTTVEYQVTHPAWKVWRATGSETDISAAALYGEQFTEALTAKPSSAFLAEGSAVTVHAGQRI